MGSRSRRDFLRYSLASAIAPSYLKPGFGDTLGLPEKSGQNTPLKLDRYIDPLPMMKRLMPYGNRGKTDLYRIRTMEFTQRLHSQLPPTRLWGYEGRYPGPVLEASRDRPVEVQWLNGLPTQHLFQVDPKIHGAMPPAPAVRNVPHLHGSRTSSGSDGLPERWFVPGQSVAYHYPNGQRAAMLWYHDHAVGSTRLNVYAGLSGLYLLRDEQEARLGLPAGAYEIPLILQDRTLDSQGQLVYSPTSDDGSKLPPGEWGTMFYGELPVVNGAIYPYLEVEPRQYRLRVVNGSNSRFFNLYLNLATHPTDVPAVVAFHQIGTDGGLLGSAAKLSTLLLAPGERADLIVDFSSYVGKTLMLSNNAASPYPGWTTLRDQYAGLNELMQFRVSLPASNPGKIFDLSGLVALQGLDPRASVMTRDFVLSEHLDANGKSLGARINDKGYDDPVAEFPKLDSVEKWRFINTTDDAHPMHLHLVQFQVLERQGFDLGAFHQGRLELVGSSRKPPANEAGWKDTAVVRPGEVLTILVRFDGFTGRYVYHCHMLEHEDNDMMRPFEVVAADLK